MSCACGAGVLLPLGRGGEARLVATPEPALAVVEVATEEDEQKRKRGGNDVRLVREARDPREV